MIQIIITIAREIVMYHLLNCDEYFQYLPSQSDMCQIQKLPENWVNQGSSLLNKGKS